MKRHILALVGLLSLFASLSSNAVTLTNGNPAALPDNDPNGVLSIINTDAYFDPLEVVTSIYVTVAIDHTWVGDLAIELIAPDGTELQILARPGADQPDEDQNAPYGDGSNLDPANPTTFQDGAFPSAETLGAGVGGGADVPAGTYAPDTNGWNSTYTDFNGFVTPHTRAGQLDAEGRRLCECGHRVAGQLDARHRARAEHGTDARGGPARSRGRWASAPTGSRSGTEPRSVHRDA